jgi:uncharacterized protein (TIGR03083 family)
MTMTTTTTLAPRRPGLDHDVAVRLAATEYERALDQLRELTPEQWQAPTECPGWTVRDMAGHTVGMARMAASIREQRRQTKLASATATEPGWVFINAITALQVDEQRTLTTEQLVARFAEVGPKAARSRKRTPGFIRRRAMPVTQRINGVDEPWTIGYLTDTILTRDPWMHRADIARATGVELVLTADHDGVIVDDVVREWAGRHNEPVQLSLTGTAGGHWQFGTGGPSLELDAIEFCRLLSGRGSGATGLLTWEVPF